MKKLALMLSCIGLSLSSCSSESKEIEDPNAITGLWKSRDQHSDKPQALVAIYEYQGEYYGRMLATYDDNGNIKDTILEKKEKAPGVVGNPPYCGMDFIYNLKKEDDDAEIEYEGKILDPEKGEVYDAELWREGANLIVRGKVWIFGKNITWTPATEKDLPKGFSMSDIKDFVPEIPKTK